MTLFSSSNAIHEPPYTEPYVRWCGRTEGASPPPTRSLILLGQPPLLKNISELQPLKERISIKFNLEPLDIENTLRYVVFRLKTAGASRGIFTREAIEALYEFSGGIPLRVNNVSDRCLLIGLMQKAKVVDSKIVTDAIEDLKS